MGIWACTLWAWQQCTTTRPGEDSSSHERDNRTTSTTPTPQCRHHTNLCRSEGNNHGVLQNHNSVFKTPATLVLSSCHKPWRRSSSNGHRSNIQRQRKRKRKEQRKRIWQGNKGKGYQEGKATAYTTKESPKENSSHGISQKEETKATKERQNKCLTKEKERIQQQCATGVANLATWQKNAQQRCTTCQKHRKSNTKMEQHSGMTQTMGTTTTGTATTSQATTAYNQLSSSNNWLCQHHPLTAKHHQSTLWQHWASRRRVNTGM